MPTVSVVIPLLNTRDVIQETNQGMRAQSVKDVEILVV